MNARWLVYTRVTLKLKESENKSTLPWNRLEIWLRKSLPLPPLPSPFPSSGFLPTCFSLFAKRSLRERERERERFIWDRGVAFRQNNPPRAPQNRDNSPYYVCSTRYVIVLSLNFLSARKQPFNVRSGLQPWWQMSGGVPFWITSQLQQDGLVFSCGLLASVLSRSWILQKRGLFVLIYLLLRSTNR